MAKPISEIYRNVSQAAKSNHDEGRNGDKRGHDKGNPLHTIFGKERDLLLDNIRTMVTFGYDKICSRKFMVQKVLIV